MRQEAGEVHDHPSVAVPHCNGGMLLSNPGQTLIHSRTGLAASFPPCVTCRFLAYPPGNLRNLQGRLSKNPLAIPALEWTIVYPKRAACARGAQTRSFRVRKACRQKRPVPRSPVHSYARYGYERRTGRAPHRRPYGGVGCGLFQPRIAALMPSSSPAARRCSGPSRNPAPRTSRRRRCAADPPCPRARGCAGGARSPGPCAAGPRRRW